MEIHERSITELQEAMASGDMSAEALVDACLARIAAFDQAGPELNAVSCLLPDAHEQARALDVERRERGPRGPLHGIPVLIKDNIDVAGMPTSAGSLALAPLEPSCDAAIVWRLREAGAVILGKTTMHELAAGITSVSSLTGAIRNPYDPGCLPGGSSGGSAAAVAASYVPVAIGSDTAGSIRIPAAYQNLVGLRMSQGLLDLDGVVPLSPTQDVLGPLARNVKDLAIVLDAITDQTGQPSSLLDELRPGVLAKARIGILSQWFGWEREETEVSDVTRRALRDMEALGAVICELTLKELDEQVAGSNVIAHEFKFALADYLAKIPNAPVASLDEILEAGLYHWQMEEVLRRRAEPVSRESKAYRQARERRDRLRKQVLALFDQHDLDAIAYPVIRRPAANIGDFQKGSNGQLSPSTGLPAIAIPVGFTQRGLPVGLELLGRPNSEAHLLSLAHAWELARHPRRAPWTTPPLDQAERMLTRTLHLGAAPSKPGPRADVCLRFDLATGILSWSVALHVETGDTPVAVALHRYQEGRVGPVVLPLSRRGETESSGAIRLEGEPRQWLLEGALGVRLHTAKRREEALPLDESFVLLDIKNNAG